MYYLAKETQNTHDYVKASDYGITKAGFGTISEAMLAKRKYTVISRNNRETVVQLVKRGLAIELQIDDHEINFKNILNKLKIFEPADEINDFRNDSELISKKLIE